MVLSLIAVIFGMHFKMLGQVMCLKGHLSSKTIIICSLHNQYNQAGGWMCYSWLKMSLVNSTKLMLHAMVFFTLTGIMYTMEIIIIIYWDNKSIKI